MERIRDVSNHVPDVLSLPPKWLHLYEDFVTKNASSVSQIESALRSLTYIIPGRFRESELASESLHSGIQLLSLYHDSLLAKAVSRLPLGQRPHSTPHNRYTRYWTARSPLYARLAQMIQVVQYTELLLEMAAARRGNKARWRAVVLLEMIKAICRLLLLRVTKSRPLLSPPLPEREVDPRTLEEPRSEEEELEEDGMPSRSTSSDEQGWTMPRTGLRLPGLPNSQDITSYLLARVLTADDIKPPKSLLHRTSGRGQAAEILYILRPVIYALAMQYWSSRAEPKQRSSWKPWLIGLGIEYGARQLAKADFQDRVAGGLRGMTGLEREELRRRRWAMGWWALRGAFYDNVTKSWLNGLTNNLRNKPLLNMVGGVIEDYEFLWENYHFATATM
ncbi:MAG: Peroxisomal membrane protein pex16 [Thelocarpon superellum]|nr:MAG: Peroxisomal membrane protein pex16 [Thelocarpon superellum]